MLPLASLTPDAPNGHYGLDEAGESSVIVMRGALQASPSDTDELRDYMINVTPTPNPMNPNTNLLRKQATFGAHYSFSKQNNASVPGPPSAWPRVVADALKLAKEIVQDGMEHYNGVHCNFYPSGKAGVQPHADNEPHLLPGFPIVSCTLLSGVHRARPFAIYLPPVKKGATPIRVAEILLGHGDVVVMQGNMQQAFLHGVAPTSKKAFADAARINLTVRAFDPELQCFRPSKKAKA